MRCEGISYSYKYDGRYKNWCYLCMDDHLEKWSSKWSSDSGGFGFYRRPGIVDVRLLNTKIVSNYNLHQMTLLNIIRFMIFTSQDVLQTKTVGDKVLGVFRGVVRGAMVPYAIIKADVMVFLLDIIH